MNSAAILPKCMRRRTLLAAVSTSIVCGCLGETSSDVFLFVAKELLDQVFTVVGYQQPRPVTVVGFQPLSYFVNPGVE